MKILFDENLSCRVVREQKTIWPDCRSAAELGLKRQPDPVIWQYANRAELVAAFQKNAAALKSFAKYQEMEVYFLF